MPTIRTTLKLKLLRTWEDGVHLEFEPYGPEFDAAGLPRLKRLHANGTIAKTMLSANMTGMGPTYATVDYEDDGKITRLTWGE